MLVAKNYEQACVEGMKWCHSMHNICIFIELIISRKGKDTSRGIRVSLSNRKLKLGGKHAFTFPRGELSLVWAGYIYFVHITTYACSKFIG